MAILERPGGVTDFAGTRPTSLGRVPRWREVGAPLLPRSLREVWADKPLPDWVAAALGRERATASDLGPEVWDSPTPPSAAVIAYVQSMVAMRRRSAAPVPAIGAEWPHWLLIEEVPWTTRTCNSLRRARLFGNTERLSEITYGELLAFRWMGVTAVLDLAATAEAVFSSVAAPRTAVDQNVLQRALQSSWSDQVSSEDPRFADLLPLGKGTVKERITASVQQVDNDPGSAWRLEQLASAIPGIEARLPAIEDKPLDVALREYLVALSHVDDGPRLEALVARFGWGGLPPCLLKTAADIAGLTRQRVCQLEAKTRAKLASHPVFMPQLDKALELAAGEAASGDPHEVARLLHREGITTVPFHGASLSSAALLCGRGPLAI